MVKALKFAHVYGTYQVDSYDSLEEAIEAALYASDMGMEALEHIEYEGKKITWNSKVFKEYEQARYAAYKAEQAKVAKPTHWVMVKDVKGKWAHAEPITNPADTQAHEWRVLVGSERVKLQRIKR